MPKNKRLIDLYKEWMETGFIKDINGSLGLGGICNAVPEKYRKTIELFRPDTILAYWASTKYKQGHATNENMYRFNELRQSIVLLICCIHNEL